MDKKTFSPLKKDKIKIFRSILEAIILIIIAVIIIKSMFSFTKYMPYDSANLSSDQSTGFIAVSYFGVDRTGTDTLISTGKLDEHLKALKDNGYVTITQKDIKDYYLNGKTLPKKSIFLLFEDGRTDTAIFSQKLIEEYNFKGTMLTYADKFEKEDTKFLSPKGLLKLQKSSYWELGTNGYRLEYINVFDKDSKYLGRLDSIEFSKLASTIDRDYNHYLMDYIRDEDSVPTESYEEMKKRVDYDYESLNKIYKEKLGYVPELYVLMHSNTGQFGTNKKVSQINEDWIKDSFYINFNREGYSLNKANSSIYDLTRIQPQAYWSTNHLLMRIWDDTKQDTEFVVGDKAKSSKFEEVSGKAEFKDESIILTSLPKDKGILKLQDSDKYKDIKLSANLNGNIIGSQGIYLRSDEDQNNSIYIELINNEINIIEKSNGNEKNIFSSKLDKEDNEKDKFDIKDPGSRKLDVTLENNKISLSIDGVSLAENLEVSNTNGGSVYLESKWAEYGYSQRNLSDDVYDGIFEKLKITDLNDNKLYDSSFNGIEKIAFNIKNLYNNIINWFIKYL